MAVLNQVDRDGHSFTPDIYPFGYSAFPFKKAFTHYSTAIHTKQQQQQQQQPMKRKGPANHQNESKNLID